MPNDPIQLELIDKKNALLSSLEHLKSMKISKSGREREVVCFCGEVQTKTILPHLRERHPDVWESWKSIFVTLRNEKWSHKRIMNLFTVNGRLLFTWSIVEKELRKIEENGEADLEVWRKDTIASWTPHNFELQRTTVWDFPRRGDWAVHQGDYRGNWPPQLARNLILNFTHKNDLVVDLFAGGGTTLIEAWLTGRKSLGLDTSDRAIKTMNARLNEIESHKDSIPKSLGFDICNKPQIRQADSRKCGDVFSSLGWRKGQVGLFCAHPPYLDALPYTESNEDDLSRIRSEDDFCSAMRTVASEAKPWLKRNGVFALLIGDVRRQSKLIPLGYRLMQEFLLAGYDLKEIIIKKQNQDSSSNLWAKNKKLQYLIAHEYLLLFTKT